MDYSLQPDTLRCNRSIGTIQITNNTTIGYYNWQTANGNITDSNSDSSQININKAGTYIVSASPAQGCPATRTDTVVIPIDTFPPVASITAAIGSNFSYLQFYGGDMSASNYATPFGGSHGLLWNWSGPGGFSSTIQNPINDTVWGTYQLVVTEKRNGCTDTTTKPLSIDDFSILAESYLNLNGIYSNGSILLKWQDRSQSNTQSYIIEKSSNGTDFNEIGAVNGAMPSSPLLPKAFSFTDERPDYGNNFYRIKSITANGQSYYSNTITINTVNANQETFYLANGQTGNPVYLVCNVDKGYAATVVLFNMAGQLLLSKRVQITKGSNMIELPASENLKSSVIAVSLFANNQLLFAQKTIF